MLQEMRSHGKIIWAVLFIAFVGVYLLFDTSGLLGTQAITSGTSVGSVNGTTITYGVWQNHARQLAEQRTQQIGRALDLDERAQIDQQAFEELVMDVIFRAEYDRRGIRVTDEEIRQFAQQVPPTGFLSAPEFQTDGQFDRTKWERYLTSPSARQQGLLFQLEQYYREMIPKEKLFAQLASDVYASDAELWRMYQDEHDTVEVSFVNFPPTAEAQEAALAQVTDAEVSAYYQQNRRQFQMTARGVVTALIISRKPTSLDSAATLERARALRARIVGGAAFEDVAREASDDSLSAADGGALPAVTRGAGFIKEFEDAVFSLRPGQISEPIRTDFGWHIIRVDSRKGDTVTARHILAEYRQTDSVATATDRRADSLAVIASGASSGARLDSAARVLGLTPVVLDVVEGQRAYSIDGTVLPGLAQWATGGTALVGEVSDLFDSDSAYFLARLDSLKPGGQATLADVRDNIRQLLARKKAVESRVQEAREFARSAVSVSLEEAARLKNVAVQRSGAVTRRSFAPSLGASHPAIGAAFGLVTGSVGEPVVAHDGVYVVRVDRRRDATRDAWTAQLAEQREQVNQRMQQDYVRQYISSLREQANVVDKRKDVFAAGRRQTLAAEQAANQ